MKNILQDLAELVSRASRTQYELEQLKNDASRTQYELVQLENDARDLMYRIEFAEAQKLEVNISPTQMLCEIRERCFDIPLHLDNSPGRATATLGQITAQGENMDEAVTNLYKLLKYRETTCQ